MADLLADDMKVEPDWETHTTDLVTYFLHNHIWYGAHGGVINLGNEFQECAERHAMLINTIVPLLGLKQYADTCDISVTEMVQEGDQYCASILFERKYAMHNNL